MTQGDPCPVVRLRRGLDLQIPGAPDQCEPNPEQPESVGILANDYPGLRVVVQVKVGQRVRVGEAVLSDARAPEIRIPAPAAGTVVAIHREGRRPFGVEIEVGQGASCEFPSISIDQIREGGRDLVSRQLLESGDWCALRERPFGRLATPGTVPEAIFVRAMDSNPLAVDAERILGERPDDFRFGLNALAELTIGPVYVCGRLGSAALTHEIAGVESVAFEGPHPAGLVGTHIHHLLPVSQTRTVWYLGFQDVLAIGHLFRLGKPDSDRVVSIAGPGVAEPRIVRTTIGASTEALVAAPPEATPCRVISGSVLSGRLVARPTAFLGRYHEQIVVLPERSPPQSETRLGFPRRPWRRGRKHWTAELHGPRTPFFPLDEFDRVVPLSIPMGPLLRALAARDARSAIALGALELEEEDLALCNYHCPAKIDYGPLLRDVLDASAEARP